MSLRAKSMVAVITPLIFLAASVSWVFHSSQVASKAEDDLQRGLRALAQIHAVHAQLAEAASGVRGYLLTQRPEFLEPFHRADAEIKMRLGELSEDVRDPLQRGHLEDIRQLIAIKMMTLRAIVNGADPQGREALREDMVENKALLDRLRVRIAEMEAEEARIIERRSARAASARQRNLAATATASILGVLLAVAIAVGFSRYLIDRIRRIGEDAGRLEAGQPLPPRSGPTDELGRLAATIGRVGNLLTERARDAQTARAEAEQANRHKTEFLSRASHELRTPMNAILGYAQRLDRELEGHPSHGSIAPILSSGRHLSALLDDVLDISRIESGSLAIRAEPTPAAPLIADVMSFFRAAVAARSIRLLADIPEVEVLADPTRLRQILINLIDNAIKYNREHGEVRIRGQIEQDMLRIDVEDTGRGIANALLPRLFLPFERLGETQLKGTGLGLAVSHRLVEAMGGSMGVESREGTGSRFWLRLPLAPECVGQVPQSGTASPRTLSRVMLGEPSTRQPKPGPLLLLLHPSPAHESLIRALLRRSPEWHLQVRGSLTSRDSMPAGLRLIVRDDSATPPVAERPRVPELDRLGVPIAVIAPGRKAAATTPLHFPAPLDVARFSDLLKDLA